MIFPVRKRHLPQPLEPRFEMNLLPARQGQFPQSPATSNSFGGGDFGGTRVANVTPVESPSSGINGGSNFDSSLTKAWNNGTQQSQLKPIGVGTSNEMPGNRLRRASLQSSDRGGSNASAIPAAFDQGRHAMTGHVSDVDIPSKILSGSGSYAPGSVNKVR